MICTFCHTPVIISRIGINTRPHTAKVKTETDSAVKSGMAGLTFQIMKHKKTVKSRNKPYITWLDSCGGTD